MSIFSFYFNKLKNVPFICTEFGVLPEIAKAIEEMEWT